MLEKNPGKRTLSVRGKATFLRRDFLNAMQREGADGRHGGEIPRRKK